MIYHIADLRKELEGLIGISISFDQIRKLEKAGLTYPVRNPTNNYREYPEENYRKSMRNLLYYYFNAPIKDILSNDPEVMKAWIKKIKKAVRQMEKEG